VSEKVSTSDKRVRYWHYTSSSTCSSCRDETSQRYLFVAIDHATRWFFTHVYGAMN
jgi:hypothetical protein